MVSLLHNQAEVHKIQLDTQDVSVAFHQLIERVNKKRNERVVILIDEYDALYLRIYLTNKNEASRMLGTLQDIFTILNA